MHSYLCMKIQKVISGPEHKDMAFTGLILKQGNLQNMTLGMDCPIIMCFISQAGIIWSGWLLPAAVLQFLILKTLPLNRII